MPEPMTLVIVRHGKAEPSSPDGTDAARPLAPRGVLQASELARVIPRSIGAIVSSPAVRAWRTASIIAEAREQSPAPDARLAVDEPIAPVLDLIAERAAPAACLLLAGHNPQLSSLVGLLALGPNAPGVMMKTGQAVVLRIDAAAATEPARLPGAAVVEATFRLDDK